MAFGTSGLKILKLCLNILNVPMLILLVAYVTKYHWGIQTTCNNLLQLSKWKQGSAISGAVEGACIEFMREFIYLFMLYFMLTFTIKSIQHGDLSNSLYTNSYTNGIQ